MKYFTINRDNGHVDLNREVILLIKEFKALLDVNRNKTKTDKTGKFLERAQKEFTYMFLYMDWESPYFKYQEIERHNAALDDSGLSEKDLEDPEFRIACNKYNELQNQNQELRLLKACLLTVDNVIHYLENVDVNERDPETGKPIFKTKDVIAEIKGAKDLITSIKDLESKVKESLIDESSVRGGVELGMFD